MHLLRLCTAAYIVSTSVMYGYDAIIRTPIAVASNTKLSTRFPQYNVQSVYRDLLPHRPQYEQGYYVYNQQVHVVDWGDNEVYAQIPYPHYDATIGYKSHFTAWILREDIVPINDVSTEIMAILPHPHRHTSNPNRCNIMLTYPCISAATGTQYAAGTRFHACYDSEGKAWAYEPDYRHHNIERFIVSDDVYDVYR